MGASWSSTAPKDEVRLETKIKLGCHHVIHGSMAAFKWWDKISVTKSITQ